MPTNGNFMEGRHPAARMMRACPNGGQDPAPPYHIWLLVLIAALLWPVRMDGAAPIHRHAIESPVELGGGVDFVKLPGIMPGIGVDVAERMEVEARVALAEVREKSGLNSSWWGVSLIAGEGDSITVSVRFGNASYGDFTDRKTTRVTVTRGDKTLFEDNDAKGFVAMSRAYNSLSLSIADGRLIIRGGGHAASTIAELMLAEPFIPAEVRVWSHGRATVSQFVVETSDNLSAAMNAYPGEVDDLNRRLAKSVDPVEGYWSYLDRQNDPVYARPGGRYTLAIVRIDPDDASAGYDILYISGAETLAGEWKPLMLKGRLRPTIFEEHYDLEWIDSSFNRIEDDIHAKIENDNALLTLSFPLLRAVMRFSKMPK